MDDKSFIKNLFQKPRLKDRKNLTNEDPIDVIIPLINSNLLFERNLLSFYEEIPINRLIIGNGGCTDGSIEIAKKFPRVKIIDQKKNRTLGYCIAELISFVETKWFIYLHSDVYLPENWYNKMKSYQKKYDWFECDRCMVTLFEFNSPNLEKRSRAYSGSQMGRMDAFKNIIGKINDDYLYRNEDIVFHELILAEGFKYGRVFDTFHYHQIMNKRGEKEPKIERIKIQKLKDKKWEIRTYRMQVKGIIKYLQPKSYLIKVVNDSIKILKKYNALNVNDFKRWVKKTNIIWLKYIEFRDPIIILMFDIIIRKINEIYDILLKHYK